MEITLKKAGAGDIEILAALGRATFFETFAGNNTKGDMQQYLEENFNSDNLLRELANPASEFYLAMDGEEAVGYLKLNFGAAQTGLKDEAAVEIERIYVLSMYHGKKVGQLLYEKALNVAAADGKQYVWLGVWEENRKAIRFYEKNGFEPFGKHDFRLGDDIQTDLMMKKMLR